MKIILAVTIGLILVLGLGFLVRQGSASATEKPDYTVLKEEGSFELRNYPPMLLAEVQVSGDRRTAANRGFRKLASFIFGDNVAESSTDKSSSKIAMTAPVMQTPRSEKIAMTSPVVQTPQSEKIAMTAPVVQTPNRDADIEESNPSADAAQWTINFMMPSEYTMETLPKPTDADIRLFESEPYMTASVRFSGLGKKKALMKNEAKLREWIDANNHQIISGPEYAFYDAPFVPGFLRRNEVHFRVAKTEAE